VVAVDHGVLVKAGADVRVACERALPAATWRRPSAPCASASYVQSEREKRARATLARLEGDVVRRLGELRGRHGA
jgi:hypothetical protein